MRYLTDEEVFAKYQREDKQSLNSETLEAYLAPLAGTSFDEQARQALRYWSNHSHRIDAYSLFWSFFFQEFFRVGEPDGSQIADVWRTLKALRLAHFAFENTYIQTLSYLKRTELLIQEIRTDHVFPDSRRSIVTSTYFHEADQWRFYQGEKELTGINISSLYIRSNPKSTEMRYDPQLTILSEGLIETRRMVDGTYPLLPFVPPDRQEFQCCHRRIGISPHFRFA